MKIQFIPGKNLGTKDIEKRCVMMHCTVPDHFDVKEYLNKRLVLTVTYP